MFKLYLSASQRDAQLKTSYFLSISSITVHWGS